MTAFPAEFRALLATLLRRAPRVRGVRARDARARRRVTGQSGTFAGHRAYTAGDDLRLLDWNAYARSGELFLKVLEEEDRRTLTLLLDVSSSMSAGTPPRWLGARRVAAILGGLALVRLDGVRVVHGPGQALALQGAGMVPKLLDALDALPLASAQHEPRRIAQEPMQRGWLGGLVWLSDFAEPQTFAPALAALRRHGRRVTGWLPMIPDDVAPPARGWLRIVDPETGNEEAMLVDAELQRAMAEELRILHRQQDAVFAEAGCPLVRFRLPAPDDFAPGAWFDKTWGRWI